MATFEVVCDYCVVVGIWTAVLDRELNIKMEWIFYICFVFCKNTTILSLKLKLNIEIFEKSFKNNTFTIITYLNDNCID